MKGCVESKKKALEYQEGGKHYVQHAIQPVVYCMKNKLNTIDSNIVKYATRKKPGETNKQRYNNLSYDQDGAGQNSAYSLWHEPRI